MPQPSEPDLRFDAELVALFGAASHDSSPLHTSEEYARATSYGEPVVHGMLAALAVLARIPRRPGLVATRVEMTFHHPVYRDRPYDVACATGTDGYRASLRYRGEAVLTTHVALRPAGESSPRPPGALATAPGRAEAAGLSLDEIHAGREVAGRYRVDPDAFAQLVARLGLGDAVLGPAALEVLTLTSYLVGMELPGRQALFGQATVEFPCDGPLPAAGLAYRAKVDRVDPRFRLVDLVVDAGHAIGASPVPTAGPAARARLRAFVRPAARPPDRAEIRAELAGAPSLDGQVAFVVGASRGLGAAVALGLAELGCVVVGGYLMSGGRAAQVACGRDRIDMVRGDAGDPAWCAELAARIETRYGRLDLLVCAAAPPLQPMRLRTGTVMDLTGYISASVALVAAPVAACLPLLGRAGGTALVCSSQALDAPPADWPHYVAAKGALEPLIAALAIANREVTFQVIRPPALDTELVERLVTAEPVMSTARYAANLIREYAGQRLEVHSGPH